MSAYFILYVVSIIPWVGYGLLIPFCAFVSRRWEFADQERAY